MTPSIVWFRRDLRLHDHPALLAARDAAGADGPGQGADGRGEGADGLGQEG